MKKLTDKLEELYTGEKQQLLLEEATVEMIEEPLPPGEAAGAPEKDPMTGEDSEYEDDSARTYREMRRECLRIQLGEAVVDSDKISEEVKADLLKSVEEADFYGLMSLVMDGEIKSLDDEAKITLEQRFDESPWSGIQEVGVGGNLLAMAALLPVGGPIAWAQWRVLFSIFSKAHRQCGVLRVSKDRDACLAKARLQMSQGKLKVMAKVKASCKKHKKPELCAKSIDAQMAKEMKKAEKYKKKLQKFAMKGRVGVGPAKTTQAL